MLPSFFAVTSNVFREGGNRDVVCSRCVDGTGVIPLPAMVERRGSKDGSRMAGEGAWIREVGRSECPPGAIG